MTVTIGRRELLAALGGAAAAWPLAARAQAERMRRVGLLMGYPEGDVEGQASAAAFQRRLEELGWTEGRNVHIDTRWAGADPNKARTFAKDLVAIAPDVIVPSTNLVTAILQQETLTIPIVFVLVGDPVGSGFVATMARPGGNLTGFSVFEPAIGGKWLEIFKEMERIECVSELSSSIKSNDRRLRFSRPPCSLRPSVPPNHSRRNGFRKSVIWALAPHSSSPLISRIV
jgi:hypothetical protein